MTAPRGNPRQAEPVRWTQESLIPPDVLELILRVGVVRSGDHLEAMWSIREPGDDTLVARCAYPCMDGDWRDRQVRQMLEEVSKAIYDLTHPF